MFSGFLKPKPSGGKKPMIGKQIITPGSANTPINFGFHDGTGYSAGVVVPVTKVLATETIAGQTGTMPSKLAENLGTLGATLLNLITNGNFANGLTGWTGGVIDTVNKKFGTQSTKIVSSDGVAVTICSQNVSLTLNHIYYASAWFMKTASITGTNSQFDISGISPEMDWGTLDNTTIPTINTWYNLSNRISAPVTASAPFRFYTISTNPIYGDGFSLIDLTAVFGAGLEPAQAQMDAIMTALGGWFDGNSLLTKIASGGYINNGALGTPEVLLNDPNHRAENIISGKNVYGVAGIIVGVSSLTAGANIVNLDTSVVSTTATVYTKIYELKMLVGGSIRFIFDLLTISGAQANAQIYKNGVAVGTLRSATTGVYTTFTEDITFNTNDLLQIYANVTSSNTAQASNIKLGSSVINPAIVRTL